MPIKLQLTGDAVAVEKVPAKAWVWKNDGVIAVGLKSVTADKFLSKDGGDGSLEGIITFGLNGQDTAVGWTRKQDAGNTVKTDPTLLYFGRANALDKEDKPIADERVRIELGCEMIESDKSDKDRIEQWRKGLEVAGGFAGMVPGYGAPVAAGIGLARTVLNIFKNRADDDTELAVRTTLTPDCEGIKISRKTPSLTIELAVHHLSPGQERKGALAVESVVFDLKKDSLEGQDGKYVLFFELVCGAGKQRRPYSFQHTLEKADTSEKSKNTTDKIVAQFQSTRELKGAELFRGEMRYGVPIRFTARVIHNKETIAAIAGLAAESGTFAAGFLPATAAGTVAKISKAESSFRSFVLPLLTGEEEYSLGTFDGYLFPDLQGNAVPYLAKLPEKDSTVTLVSTGEHGTVHLTLKAID